MQIYLENIWQLSKFVFVKRFLLIKKKKKKEKKDILKAAYMSQ